MVETRLMAAQHNPHTQVDGQETVIFDESRNEEPWVASLEQNVQGPRGKKIAFTLIVMARWLRPYF